MPNPVPNGSVRISTLGYVTEKYKGKWIGQHRLRMEKFLGRKLKKGEVVHHKNGDQINNGIRNLELMSRGEHNSLHFTGSSHTNESKEKMRRHRNTLEYKNKRHPHTEETKAKMRKTASSSKARKLRSEQSLARWANPKFREKMRLAALRRHMKERQEGNGVYLI